MSDVQITDAESHLTSAMQLVQGQIGTISEEVSSLRLLENRITSFDLDDWQESQRAEDLQTLMPRIVLAVELRSSLRRINRLQLRMLGTLQDDPRFESLSWYGYKRQFRIEVAKRDFLLMALAELRGTNA